MTRSIQRRGFTLVELLVVTGLIVFLAAIAMLTVPGIMQKNRAVDASTQVDTWLQIARARAQRDKLPRGLRLIIDQTKPAGQNLWVTEVQYTESPPVFVANMSPPYPNGLTGSPLQPHPLSPRVEFVYTVSAGGTGEPTPVGTLYDRQCIIRGLNVDQATQIVNAAASNQLPRLWMPTVGTWHQITAATLATAPLLAPDDNSNSYAVTLVLDQYPDAQVGIASSPVATPRPAALRTYHFGIYLPPRPLLGEAPMQLPMNTCIDLNAGVSSPDGTLDLAGARDYDILFAPTGQLAYTGSTQGAGHVFLWIREPRKTPTMRPVDLVPGPTFDLSRPEYRNALEAGGEQYIVAIKARGITGVAPVYWPTTLGESPYFLAQKAVAGP